jgi:pimeloyl-ACP methyl ester carboxylesterase
MGDLFSEHYLNQTREAGVHVSTPTPAGEDFLAVAGQKAYFIRKGRGKTLVLLHGILASSFVWRRNIDPLARHFDVVAPDIKGHGRSDKAGRGQFSREGIRAFMMALLDSLGVERAFLAGHSWGGGIALDLALSHPDRVEKVVLLDSTGYPGGNGLAERLLRSRVLPPLLTLLGRPLVRYMLKKGVFFDRSLVTDEEIDHWLASARASAPTLPMLRAYDFVMDEEIAKISQPVLILWGKEDRLMPQEMAEHFHRDIRDSTLRVIKNCGHNPQEEKPEEVNQAMRDFLLDVKGAFSL